MECWDDVLKGEVSDGLLRGVLDAVFSKDVALQTRELHVLIPEVNVLGMVVDYAELVWRFKKTLASQTKTPVLHNSAGKFVVPSSLEEELVAHHRGMASTAKVVVFVILRLEVSPV
jgi:hypothetical protein